MRTGLQLRHPSHALGEVIQAMENGSDFCVTGTAYGTRDGSGIRDYVHVWDLASAHVAALAKFDTLPADADSLAIALGTGTGTTVKELVEAFNSVSDRPISAIEADARPGDVVGAYTRSDRAERLLGWRAEYSIVDGIRHSPERATVRDTVLTNSGR